MDKKSLYQVMETFDPAAKKKSKEDYINLTIAMPRQAKQHYDKLQEVTKLSEKRFNEHLREVILLAIDKALEKVS